MGYSPWGRKKVGHDLTKQQTTKSISIMFVFTTFLMKVPEGLFTAS